MPKGIPNKRYTPEFKEQVIKTMLEEGLGYRETCRRFEVNSRDQIKSWERIYLEEGPEGFRVERRGRGSTGRPKKLPKEAEEFLAGVRMDWKNGSFALVKDQLYFLPEGVCAAKGLRYLRTGLSLGTVKKNRFEPSQALAAYLKKEEYVSCLTIPKGDDRVMRYLKGETLSFSEEECQGKKGWVLVCLDDFPLGWGKINNGTLKNKYYAGWRMV